MAFERENADKKQAKCRGGTGFLWAVFFGVFSILILFVPELIKFFQMVSEILYLKNVFFKGEDKVEKNAVKRNEHRSPAFGGENAVEKMLLNKTDICLKSSGADVRSKIMLLSEKVNCREGEKSDV